MSGPQPSRRPYWVMLVLLPALIWLAVFVVLDQIGGFQGVMASLTNACEGALIFLPACGDLDARQSSVTQVPREFLAASYVVILGATAIALALAVVMAVLMSLSGHVAEQPRERWMFWATAAGIVLGLLLFLPKPALRIPSASAVSLMLCLLGGVAALLVYLKLTQLWTRGRRGNDRAPRSKPPDAPSVVRR